MPIYDYKCDDCGQVSELLLPSVDTINVSCPDCGSIKTERLLSASYMIKMGSPAPRSTGCGSADRCEMSSCSNGNACCENC